MRDLGGVQDQGGGNRGLYLDVGDPSLGIDQGLETEISQENPQEKDLHLEKGEETIAEEVLDLGKDPNLEQDVGNRDLYLGTEVVREGRDLTQDQD